MPVLPTCCSPEKKLVRTFVQLLSEHHLRLLAVLLLFGVAASQPLIMGELRGRFSLLGDALLLTLQEIQACTLSSGFDDIPSN